MASPSDSLHRNLMINFIPLSWDDTALNSFFSTFGQIEACKVVTNKGSTTSKGYGFVKFVNRHDAENCLATAQGMEVEGGKRIKIQKAELGKGPQGTATIYLSGFDPSATGEAELQLLCSPYGSVVKVLLHTPRPGMNGVAFVTFEFFAEAQLAVDSLNGCQLGNNKLVCRLAEQTVRSLQQQQVGATGRGPVLPIPQPIMPFQAAGFGMPAFPQALTMGYQMQAAPFIQRAMPQAASHFHPYKRGATPVTAPRPAVVQLDPNGTVPPNGEDGMYCLFVYGIQGVQDKFLWNLFSPYGTIFSCQVPQGKNFGFVNMPLYSDAVNAINNLNGAQLPGLTRPIQVSLKSANSKMS